jgi:hypothetical protein
MKQHTPPGPGHIFEKLVNTNAIKRKIDGPPWQFFLKPLTPQEFWQKHPVPPPLDFQPVCIYACFQFLEVCICSRSELGVHDQ